MNTDIQLVLDTLYERELGGRSCVKWNAAGIRLLESADHMLPVIEQVLREVVDPVLSTGKPETDEFRGLDYVLGAYMIQGVKWDPDRMVRFLSTVSIPLLVEAVLNIPVFFAPEGEGHNPGVSPEGRLMDFVRALLNGECEEARIAATRALERMSIQKPE